MDGPLLGFFKHDLGLKGWFHQPFFVRLQGGHTIANLVKHYIKMSKLLRGCRFVPSTFSETKPQMVPRDLNIGFQGLALIQGQIYNPVLGWQIFWDCLLFGVLQLSEFCSGSSGRSLAKNRPNGPQK